MEYQHLFFLVGAMHLVGGLLHPEPASANFILIFAFIWIIFGIIIGHFEWKGRMDFIVIKRNQDLMKFDLLMGKLDIIINNLGQGRVNKNEKNTSNN